MGAVLQEQIRDQVAVLALGGRLASGPDVAGIHDRIRDLARSQVVHIVVDFSDVEWFGSAMLGVLAASYTTLQNAGGGICLCGVSEKIRAIMAVARLTDVFRTCDTVDDAMASFAAAAE